MSGFFLFSCFLGSCLSLSIPPYLKPFLFAFVVRIHFMQLFLMPPVVQNTRGIHEIGKDRVCKNRLSGRTDVPLHTYIHTYIHTEKFSTVVTTLRLATLAQIIGNRLWEKEHIRAGYDLNTRDDRTENCLCIDMLSCTHLFSCLSYARWKLKVLK